MCEFPIIGITFGTEHLTKGFCKKNVEVDVSVFENVNVHVVNSQLLRADFVIAVVKIKNGKVSVLTSSKVKPVQTQIMKISNGMFFFLQKLLFSLKVAPSMFCPFVSNLKGLSAHSTVLELMGKYPPKNTKVSLFS